MNRSVFSSPRFAIFAVVFIIIIGLFLAYLAKSANVTEYTGPDYPELITEEYGPYVVKNAQIDFSQPEQIVFLYNPYLNPNNAPDKITVDIETVTLKVDSNPGVRVVFVYACTESDNEYCNIDYRAGHYGGLPPMVTVFLSNGAVLRAWQEKFETALTEEARMQKQLREKAKEEEMALLNKSGTVVPEIIYPDS